MIEASVVDYVAVAADCEEDTQLADAAAAAAAGEQVYEAVKCSGLELQQVSQQVS